MKIDEEMGVCTKNLEKVVLSQNKLCKEVCGELEGIQCSKGCMEHYKVIETSTLTDGMTLIKNVQVNGHNSDAVVIKNKDELTTLFYPLKNKFETIESELNQFKKYGLTNSELDILGLSLKGLSNAEMAKKLFIAKSTLKTHLNNIYKKLPPEMHYRRLQK